MRAVVAGVVAALGLLAGPAGAAPSTPGALGRLDAKVRLDAPAASVLTIFGDVARYPEIFRNVRRAEIVSTSPDGHTTRWWIQIDLGWPLGTRWMRGTTTWSDPTIAFHRTAGTVRRFDGTLTVLAKGHRRCLAVYDATFDLGPPRPPSWLGSLVEGAVMPGLIADARRYLSASVCASTSARCQTGGSAP